MSDRDQGRERPRAGARLWPTAGRAGAAAPGWPDEWSVILRAGAVRLREWLAFDLAPGRLVPWIPVAFGSGVALYFAADTEPALWAGFAASILALSVCIAARARAVAWPAMIGATAIAAGFMFATWKTSRVAHPVLSAPAYGVTLSGFVVSREERERSDRIVVHIHAISGPRLDTKLERVRLSVRKGTAPAVASFIEVRARLSPPLTPLRPGGYDFARDYYFQRLGATGFVLGNVKQATPPHPPDLSLRLTATIAGIRDAIDARIRAVLPGDKGAIASALITGKRDAITSQVNEAMYVSSLAHVLSISGYHMAVVAGVVFFVVRAGLALIPGVASRRPIKKRVNLIERIDDFRVLLPYCYHLALVHSLAHCFIDGRSRIALHRRNQVRVGIQGQLDAGMAQPLLDDFGMHSLDQQMGGMAVPQVVKSNPRQAAALNKSDERVGEHARGPWAAVLT